MTAPNGSDHRVWLDLLAAMILPLIELFEILWDGLNAYQELTASIPMPSLHIVWTATPEDLSLHLHARGIRNARPTADPTELRIMALTRWWVGIHWVPSDLIPPPASKSPPPTYSSLGGGLIAPASIPRKCTPGGDQPPTGMGWPVLGQPNPLAGARQQSHSHANPKD